MREIVIVDAVRTPIGKYKGSLRGVRADHLGAVLLAELLVRNGIKATDVDDVVFGCVTQVGEQSANIARTALLSAGFPESVPGITVDRKCGSAEAAIHVAVGEIASGACDVVIAGGAENMTRVKMGGNREIYGETFGWKLIERSEMVSQGEAAERVADKWNISRSEMDEFSLESHRRAVQAYDEGRFDKEIVPVKVNQWKDKGAEDLPDLTKDETFRRDTNLEKLGGLKPSFRPEGRVTAGNSSQISDGSSLLLLMSADAAKRLGLKPRARIRAVTTVGVDPTLMLTGPVAATRKILDRAGLSLSDIDLFEVNEAFASVPLMWLRETGVPHQKLNVNGGAVALGHPLGASGARIMTTLLNELERRGARYGLQSICCAGGLGTATIIERI